MSHGPVALGCVYTTHPLDLTASAAVPRLTSELLVRLAQVHSSWRVSAASPEAVALPEVRTVSLGRKPRPRLAHRVRSKVTGKAYKPYPFLAKIRAYTQDFRDESVMLSMRPQDIEAVRKAGFSGKVIFWIRNHPFFTGSLDRVTDILPSCDLVVFPVASLAEMSLNYRNSKGLLFLLSSFHTLRTSTSFAQHCRGNGSQPGALSMWIRTLLFLHTPELTNRIKVFRLSRRLFASCRRVGGM